jgi:hypothetical protein
MNRRTIQASIMGDILSTRVADSESNHVKFWVGVGDRERYINARLCIWSCLRRLPHMIMSHVAVCRLAANNDLPRVFTALNQLSFVPFYCLASWLSLQSSLLPLLKSG